MRAMRVAVVGATGAVGGEMLRVLEQRDFPISGMRVLASARSAGTTIRFRERDLPVETCTPDAFDGIDLALFSAGAERSRSFAPAAVRAGALVVDNSSAFRMDPQVPLVVPEVNPDAAFAHRGIIANPNCSTIQMVVALQPLRREFGLRRIVVATYQSVSGTGARALRELDAGARAHLAGTPETAQVYPHPIAFNGLPHIDVFEADGSTREEHKMRDETRRILDDPGLPVIATCVRVPVFRSHSEAVVVETERPVDLERAAAVLRAAPGVTLCEPASKYPLPRDSAGKDAVYVGRLRAVADDPRALALWVVSDNLRKGAALNAVQIAELVVGGATARAGGAR
jgi:aspartate-semialdehyde dehydrogenase